MKVCIVLCLFTVLAVALASPEEKYTDKYDNTNVEEIVTNERLLESFFKCLMGQGKCTPEGKLLQGHMQDALSTACAKCTDVQKKQTRYVMKHLINEKPEYWNQLTAKYDPTKKYATQYENELKELKN